jgi:hypothetical protein
MKPLPWFWFYWAGLVGAPGVALSAFTYHQPVVASMNRASVAIFRTSDGSQKRETTTPEVPDEIFLAAKRVIESKGSEIIKSHDGFYIVKYSERGPFIENVPGWLPVYIAKVHEWSSGGIRQTEWQHYEDSVSP